MYNLYGGGCIGLKNDGTINLDVNEITLTTGVIRQNAAAPGVVTIEADNDLNIQEGHIDITEGVGSATLTLASIATASTIRDSVGRIEFDNSAAPGTGVVLVNDGANAKLQINTGVAPTGQARFLNTEINSAGGVGDIHDSNGILIGNGNTLTVHSTIIAALTDVYDTVAGAGAITIAASSIGAANNLIDFNANN